MLLKNLIKKKIYSNNKNLKIKDLSTDSRKIKKGDLFFAIKGNKTNGILFIKEALKKGAAAIIVDKDTTFLNDKKDKIIRVKNVRKTLINACKIFYNDKPKNIIAVTGTNGKSSVADFYRQLLLLQNIPVASIGTLGIRRNKTIKKINLTSPDLISLHKELNKLKKSGVENVIIEASSHGLAQGRLEGINFKTGIFTNFSQDHLDYHKTIKKYFEAKLILFSKILLKKSNIIINDRIKNFNRLKSIAKIKKLNMLIIGKTNCTIKIDSYYSDKNFQNIIFYYANKKYKFKTTLIGLFQIENLLMAILAALTSGLSIKNILINIKNIRSVNGRLELVRTLPNKAKIFLDFAHTPDALENVLKSLKHHFKKNIILVFGCGGERDEDKRSLMAKIAEKFCSKIYVTDDNPRHENPRKIRKMIIDGFDKKENIFEIPSRTYAIKKALLNSEYNNIILIAGKGHETTQIYKSKTLKISDRSIIKQFYSKSIKFSNNNKNELLNKEITKQIFKKENLKFEGVSINSKSIKKNNIFIAIKGPKKDGHDYINEAIRNKASFCVVSKVPKNTDQKKLIKCNNTMLFLKQLANIKRSYSTAKIIAITGSSGKTTVKSLMGKILSNYGKTYFSQKSYNNHFGVPLSIANLESNHKYGVFEVGMNKPGEIKNLSNIIKPDIGIITNVGEAHIENFKNVKGIASAKAEIITNIEKNGYLILNKDDSFYKFHNKIAKINNIKVVSFGKSKLSNVSLLNIKKKRNTYILKIKIFNKIIFIETKYKNYSNISNILCCLALLKILNLEISQIKNIFKFDNLIKGRGKIYKIKRFKKYFTFIDESYNANPSSVRNAIINFSNIKKNNFKKYFLLGDMLELGKKSDLYHRNLSSFINKSDIDKLFVFGKKAFKTYQKTHRNKQGNILQNIEDFDQVFSNIIKKNDHLMIKGSNATGLNALSKNIIIGKNAL